MEQPPSSEAGSPRRAVTAGVIVCAVLLWTVVIVAAAVMGPAAVKVADDFQRPVPWGTRTLLRSFTNYPPLLAVPLLLATAVVGSSTWLVRHQMRDRRLGVAWCVAMLLAPLAAATLFWYCVMRPLAEIMGELKG